ncbi:biopolymer transporter ExbD [Chitinibacter bivalviorum]|uniref:Biopolymer transporter ExbD n=1 Tax=Chitinibacter bivalviorum TaxID=2739434 RepID=A0A7H9BFZ1_9NEIS|nr:biopolymer transporter ExbD [Chitinibacter bivalviorum]QLG87342.1 biopolymer transporter ExbD [Chitinibacter bivalviorum]
MAFGSFGQQDAAPMAEINTTPLVDVMLVLLVVFIVTAPVMTHAVKVELPKASAEVVQQQKAVIRLSLQADGALLDEKTPIDPASLSARFSAAFAQDPLTEVHLYADKTVQYERIAQTMAQAQQAGLTRIGLMTNGQGAGQ